MPSVAPFQSRPEALVLALPARSSRVLDSWRSCCHVPLTKVGVAVVSVSLMMEPFRFAHLVGVSGNRTGVSGLSVLEAECLTGWTVLLLAPPIRVPLGLYPSTYGYRITP